MEKIKESNEREVWEKEVKCEGYFHEDRPCGSYWKVKAHDIRQKKVFFMGDPLDIFGFVCPECQCFTEIPWDEIPTEIRKNAPKLQEPKKENFLEKIVSIFQK